MRPSASTTGQSVTRTDVPGGTNPAAQSAFARRAEVDSRQPDGSRGSSSGKSEPPGTSCSVQNACTPLSLGESSPVVAGKGRSSFTGGAVTGGGAGPGVGATGLGLGAGRIGSGAGTGATGSLGGGTASEGGIGGVGAGGMGATGGVAGTGFGDGSGATGSTGGETDCGSGVASEGGGAGAEGPPVLGGTGSKDSVWGAVVAGSKGEVATVDGEAAGDGSNTISDSGGNAITRIGDGGGAVR
jgi:hypothetical protein